MKLLIALFAFAVVVSAKECLRCMCEKESYGCSAIKCNEDDGSLSCGYFQIKLPYYIDCGEPNKQPDESTEDAWKRCSDDYDCAKSCVIAYVKRYASMCPGKGACEQMARLHNGGPNGCNIPKTDSYWDDIKKCTEAKSEL